MSINCENVCKMIKEISDIPNKYLEMEPIEQAKFICDIYKRHKETMLVDKYEKNTLKLILKQIIKKTNFDIVGQHIDKDIELMRKIGISKLPKQFLYDAFIDFSNKDNCTACSNIYDYLNVDNYIINIVFLKGWFGMTHIRNIKLLTIEQKKKLFVFAMEKRYYETVYELLQYHPSFTSQDFIEMDFCNKMNVMFDNMTFYGFNWLFKYLTDYGSLFSNKFIRDVIGKIPQHLYNGDIFMKLLDILINKKCVELIIHLMIESRSHINLINPDNKNRIGSSFDIYCRNNTENRWTQIYISNHHNVIDKNNTIEDLFWKTKYFLTFGSPEQDILSLNHYCIINDNKHLVAFKIQSTNKINDRNHFCNPETFHLFPTIVRNNIVQLLLMIKRFTTTNKVIFPKPIFFIIINQLY